MASIAGEGQLTEFAVEYINTFIYNGVARAGHLDQ